MTTTTLSVALAVSLALAATLGHRVVGRLQGRRRARERQCRALLRDLRDRYADDGDPLSDAAYDLAAAVLIAGRPHRRPPALHWAERYAQHDDLPPAS